MSTAIQLCSATVGMEGNAPVGAQQWQSKMADAEHSRQILVEAGTVAGVGTQQEFLRGSCTRRVLNYSETKGGASQCGIQSLACRQRSCIANWEKDMEQKEECWRFTL